MYKALFFKDSSEYYNNKELLFTVKRRRLFLGIRNVCTVYRNDELIFKFYTSEFTVLFWKVEILAQKLAKKVSVRKEKGIYNLIVDGKNLSLKFTDSPFKKTIGRTYLDGNDIGEIQKEERNSKTYFYFSFDEATGLEFYILILFSIYSVGITDSP